MVTGVRVNRGRMDAGACYTMRSHVLCVKLAVVRSQVCV